MSEELKPCPFCEQDAELKINYPAGGIGMHGAYVRCNNCGAESAFDLGESGAIESWNNRPIEDALRAEHTMLRDAVSQHNREKDKYNAEYETLEKLLRDAVVRTDHLQLLLGCEITVNATLTAERDALKAELETMRGLCQTLEANLSGQNDTVEIMHQALLEIVELRPKFDNQTLQSIRHLGKIISIARAALEKL